MAGPTGEMPTYHLEPIPGKLEADIRISGSKSISNRLLILQALAGEQATLRNLSPATDTARLRDALEMIHVCSGSRIPMTACEAGR